MKIVIILWSWIGSVVFYYFCSGSSLISVWKMWKRKVYFYNKIRLLLGFLIVHLLWFTSFYRAFKSYFFMLLMDKDFYVINGSITVYISAYLWLNSISLSLLNKNISLWSLPFLIHWIDQMVVFQVIQMLISFDGLGSILYLFFCIFCRK